MTKKMIELAPYLLSEEEARVVEKYFRGEIHMFGTSKEDMANMSRVINKASAMLEAFNGEGLEDDLIRWFIAKLGELGAGPLPALP